MQQALFGGGCFWCVEAVFLQLQGVEKVTSGYAGGHTLNPSYEDICRGDSGHAEVILIDFDEQQISYSQLLEVFFATHDPTTLNRQGNDVGTQYRSVIYYSVHDKFHRTLILSGFCFLKIAKISLNSSFFPKPIKC